MYIKTQTGKNLVNTRYVKKITRSTMHSEMGDSHRIECILSDNSRMQLGRYSNAAAADTVYDLIMESIKCKRTILVIPEDNKAKADTTRL